MLPKLSDFQMTMMNGDDNGKNAYMRAISSIDLFHRFTDSKPIPEPLRRQWGVRAQTIVLSESGDNLILWVSSVGDKVTHDSTNTSHLSRVWGRFIRRYSLIGRLR